MAENGYRPPAGRAGAPKGNAPLTTTVDDCRVLRFRGQKEPRGDLTFFEAERDVPFPIRRVYTLTGVPPGALRGGHGHHALEQLFVALSGAVDVRVADGTRTRSFRLSRPDEGLYLPRLLWRELVNFAPGTVVMVLASLPYDEADYERTWDGFLRARGLS